MSIIVVSSAVVVLITYGVFASLFWPITAVSPDVWEKGYAQLPAPNVTGTIIATTIWVVLTLVAAWGAIRLSRGATTTQRAGVTLALLGTATMFLYVPVTFASVAVYNVIPTTTPYPDRVTPYILAAGVLSAFTGGLITAIHAARTKQRTRATNDTAPGQATTIV
jgi:hypothetical protein